MRIAMMAGVLLGTMGCGVVLVGSGVPGDEVRQVEAFSEVDVSGSIDVELVLGAVANVVEVHCDDNLLENILTQVNGDQLSVDTRGSLRPRADCLVRVKTTSDVNALSVSGSAVLGVVGTPGALSEVEVAGSGGVVLLDGLVGTGVLVDVSGSGNVDLGEVDAAALDIEVSGSGRVEGSGVAVQTSVNLTGSGEVLVGGVVAQEGDVTVAGSGEVHVQVEDSVRVRITGSGDCLVDGSPVDRDVNITGSGTVTFR